MTPVRPHLAFQANVLLISLALVCGGCEQARQAASRIAGRSGHSSPGQAQWVAAQARGGAPVAGPQQPRLLWEYEVEGWKIEKVLTLDDGVVLGCALDGEDKKFSESGKHRGALLRLDSSGAVVKQLELPPRMDTSHWDSFHFSVQRGPQPQIHALCSISRTLGYDKPLSDWNNEARFGLECHSRLLAFDSGLTELWTLDLPDLSGSLGGVGIGPDGSVYLDTVSGWLVVDGQEPREQLTQLLHVSPDGAQRESYAFPAADNGQGSLPNAPVGTFAGGPPLIWAAGAVLSSRQSTRLCRWTPALKLEWNKDVVKELRCQPLALADGAVAVLTDEYDYTEDSHKANQLRMAAKSTLLMVYDRFGTRTRQEQIDSLDVEIAADADGKLLVYSSRSTDGKDEELEAAFDKRLRDSLGESGKKPKSSKPISIPRTHEVRLEQRSPRGLKNWEWSANVESVNFAPACHGPLVDKDGASYLLVGSKLYCVGPDGAERFALDLGKHKVEARQLGGGLQLGPDGTLLIHSGQRVTVFGDPAAAE